MIRPDGSFLEMDLNLHQLNNFIHTSLGFLSTRKVVPTRTHMTEGSMKDQYGSVI